MPTISGQSTDSSDIVDTERSEPRGQSGGPTLRVRKIMDQYQHRYLAHQAQKAKVLAEIIDERHSERKFGDKLVDVDPILEALSKTPSSCNRKAVEFVVYSERDDKNILSGFLVGGIGWLHRANHVILLFAKREAYKAAGEIEFMPYLDAGAMAQQALLVASAFGYAACLVNPNIRDKHRQAFESLFGDDLLCCVVAVGSKHEEN